MKRKLPLSLLAFLPLVFAFVSCDNATIENLETKIAAPAKKVEQEKITAELLPFDRFPVNSKFPLAIKFSKPVAPPSRESKENFESIQLSPSKPGVWKWWSDSILTFTPHEEWQPDTKLDLDLSNILTASDLQNKSLEFYPRLFSITFPEPEANISACKLIIKNRSPLVQTPQIQVRLNYPVNHTKLFNNLSLKLDRKDKSEDLSPAYTTDYAGMTLDIKGANIFRPSEPGKIKFELKSGTLLGGLHPLKLAALCEIPIDPKSWDEIADADTSEVKKKTLTIVEADSPRFELGGKVDTKSPLKLRFQEPWTKAIVPHGKAKGLTIEKGIKIAYANSNQANLSSSDLIEGVWKTDENYNYVISFIPKSPWILGDKLNIILDQDVFPEIQLKDLVVPVQIPGLRYQFSNTKFASNPSNPLDRRLFATLDFSHPVDIASLERAVGVSLRVEPDKNFTNATIIKRTIKQDDKMPWRYYVESDPVELPKEPGEIRVGIGEGVVALIGGEPTYKLNWDDVSVPSKSEVFKIEGLDTSIVTRPDQKMERVISIEVSESTRVENLQGSLEAYLLPDCNIESNSKICSKRSEFGQEDIVSKSVLDASEKVTLSPLPKNEETQPNLFLFSLDAPGKRELFVRIKNGLLSKTEFKLAKDFRKVLFLNEFDKQLKIMHEGSLLSLSGAKKLGLSFRNIKKVEYELARILPDNVHHLISSSSGNLTSPVFNWGALNLNQLAEKTNYTEDIPVGDPGKTQYSVVNFEKFVRKGKSPTGLFYLKVKEVRDVKPEAESEEECEGEDCDQVQSEGESDSETQAENESYSSEYYEQNGYGENAPMQDRRLVLLTDIGIVVKNSLAEEKDVFVMSFNTGSPIAGATVKLVGQNGVALFTKTTGTDGKASFPSAKDLKKEKLPLMYVVTKGDDYSFLPFSKGERTLNFSKFSTEGVVNEDEAEGLRAMVFSDRGIYRPGEEARFGIIVRKRNLGPVEGEIPLEITLRDPRGIEVLNQKFSLSKLGFDDFRWSSENALTGTYNISINLVRGTKEEKKFLLGATSFRVDEFQPDKLSVKSKYLAEMREDSALYGWYKSNGSIEVAVKNLFGTPAVNNKVSGTLVVTPWDGHLSSFPDYNFYPQKTENSLSGEPENLGELMTDEQGVVKFTPDLGKFSEGAFNIEFGTEAFEKDSGRSVLSSFKSLISDSKSFIGWKVDGALDYINKASARKVSFFAVDPAMKSVALADLTLELVETKMISTLVKQPNGSLSYEMTPKKEVISNSPLIIAEGSPEMGGVQFDLKTDTAGKFTLNVKDKEGKQLNQISYTVYGEGNSSFMNDRSTEVGIKLKKSSVVPDEELEVAINTPYTGTGLITIERDKVYAHKWFKADSISSVQTIKVPKEIIGNAYLSVSFVRSMDSKEIFGSPLSYGVKPFYIAKSEYTAGIELVVPDVVRPGGDVKIAYKIDKPGRFLLYAVDEGILQFAKYKNPQPVDNFVPKRALEVTTMQILDMLLPEYSIVESLSKVGGDEDFGLGKFKNPFARKKRPPLAFWSGILPEGSTVGTINVPVPEYFNGTLRVIAVAVTENKLGVETKSFIAQNEFVIDPQAPYFVSPGDEFEIGATIANTVIGSGRDVKLLAQVSKNDSIEILDDKPVELVVPEGEDRVFRIKARAKDEIGEKSYKIQVSGLGGKRYSVDDSLSIRPASVISTTIASGIYRPDRDKESSAKLLNVDRNLYSELRDVKSSISFSPLTVGRALASYLKNYPYGCTEQVVSAAFPAIMFGAENEIGLDKEDVEKFSKRAFRALSSRQKADGSFGYWDLQSPSDGFYSVYAAHFLLEARERGFDIPNDTYNRAIEFLTSIVNATEYDLQAQLVQSYALYVLARSGSIVTKDAQALVSNLDRQWHDSWRNSLMSTFLAGTFKVLQLDKEGDELLQKLPEVWKPTLNGTLNDPYLFGALYTYISFKHFPEEKWLSPLDTVVPINRMFEDYSYTSFKAAFTLLGLSSFTEKQGDIKESGLKMTAIGSTSAKSVLELQGHTVLSALVPEKSEKVEFFGPKEKVYFYEMNQTGFDRGALAKKEQGISISREYRNNKNELTKDIALEDKLEVTLFIKASEPISRVAVVELVPGGFEIDLSDSGLAERRSLKPGPNTWVPTFMEIQEDRIIFYGDLPADTASFTYKLKPVSRGQFRFPAPYAEAMYDLKKKAIGDEDKLLVK